MIQHVDSTMQAIGFIAGKNRPVVQVLAKYWWLTIPAAIAIGTRLWHLKKDKTLSVYTSLRDAGLIVTPVAAIITLAEMAHRGSSVSSPSAVDAAAAAKKTGAVTDVEVVESSQTAPAFPA